MSSNYRLERWIAIILALLFLVPFIAEAENFYVEFVRARRNTPAESSRSMNVVPENLPAVECALPEDVVANPIDDEPSDDDCC